MTSVWKGFCDSYLTEKIFNRDLPEDKTRNLTSSSSVKPTINDDIYFSYIKDKIKNLRITK